MGFSTLLDILGSTLIGSLLLLILLRMHDSSSTNLQRFAAELMVQQNLVSIVDMIEHDFRKIGYSEDIGAIDPRYAIISADSNLISFKTDFEPFGDIDSIKYWFDKNESTPSPNENEHYLYRIENGETPVKISMGVTRFSLTYFDALGDKLSFPISDPSLIKLLEINLRVESPWALSDGSDDSAEYQTVFWKQIRMAARNITER